MPQNQELRLRTLFSHSIDLDYLHKIRKEMPLWDQRRPEVYKQHQG